MFKKKAFEEKIEKIKSDCLSKETPCKKCIEVWKCKSKIFDVKKRFLYLEKYVQKSIVRKISLADARKLVR